jgi:hypothetical protein
MERVLDMGTASLPATGGDAGIMAEDEASRRGDPRKGSHYGKAYSRVYRYIHALIKPIALGIMAHSLLREKVKGCIAVLPLVSVVAIVAIVAAVVAVRRAGTAAATLLVRGRLPCAVLTEGGGSPRRSLQGG